MADMKHGPAPYQGGRRRVLIAVFATVLAVLLGSGGWLYLANAGGVVTGIGGPFALTDGAGHVVTDRALRGRYLLVYFGYTFCPDVCPTTLAAIAGATKKLGPRADEVQPLFITVDPKRDTPVVIGNYVTAFGGHIIGLTGTPDQVARVAAEYRVYYAPQPGNAGEDYSVDHSSIVYLMGKDGRFIAPIRTDATAGEMAADITRQIGGST